jgi:replicative DNA helicase
MATAEKLLPQNNEAEMGTLGSLLIDPEALDEVRDWLAPDDFWREAHRAIYQAMIDLFANRQPADLITLSDELARRGKLEDIGGLSYIGSLANQVPTSGNLTHYARIVDRTARNRRLIKAVGQIAAIAYNDPEAEVAETAAMNHLFEVTSRKSRSGFVDFGQVLDETYQDTLRRMEAEIGAGIQSGIKALDAHLLGFEPGEFELLVGRPSSGKSVIGATVALNVADRLERTLERNEPGSVAWITLEMGRVQQARRLIAAVGEVNTRKMRQGFKNADGTIDEDAYERYMAAWNDLRLRLATRIRIKDGSGSLSEIRALLAQEVKRKGAKIAIIDQLDLMESDDDHKNEKEIDRIARYSRELKIMAGAFEIPILCLAQLNRATEQNVNSEPTLGNIANSDRLGRDTDIVMAAHRPSEYDVERARSDPHFAQYGKLLLLKARDNVKNVYVPYRFQGEYTRVTDWPESWPNFG